MLATVNEVNSDKKRKVTEESIFRNLSFVCFTAEIDEQIDSQLSLLLNYGCTRV